MRTKIIKNKSGYSCPKLSDVKLSINSGGGGTKTFVVTFYNGNHKKVTTTNFIIPSIDSDLNRLYFETGNHIEGFKVSDSGSSKITPKIRFHIDNEDEWKNRVGFFNLVFDSSERLYYVDLNNKI